LNCSDEVDKHWKLEPYGGFFRIRVLSTDWYLNVGTPATTTASTSFNTPMWGPTTSSGVYTVSDGYYKIHARHSLRCLDRDGYDVVQWSCHGSSRDIFQQQWRFAVEPTN